MKKALMVLSFALCATFAFAQTNVVSRNDAMRAKKPNMSELKAAQVDYKASIFTKDGEAYDTVAKIDFTDMTGIVLNGYVQQDEHIIVNGRDSVYHNNYNRVRVQNNPWCQWYRFVNTTDLANRCSDLYPNNDEWFSRQGEADKGGYFAGLVDSSFVGFVFDEAEGASSQGYVNAYMELPAQTRTLASGTSKMVIINMIQLYFKYYDQCFIDYQIGGTWYAREVNVMGVDVDVNSQAAYKARYVMPQNLANQNNIKLRFRIYSYHRGAAYGYFWLINKINIISDNRTHSYEPNTSSTFDGFYGMIPQGMNIPLTYGVQIRNTNLNDINNAKITITSAPANTSGEWSTVASSTPFNVPAGNVEKDYRLYINERGFLPNTSHDDDTTYSWGKYSYLENQPNYGRQQAGYGAGYQGRGFNTQNLGTNFYAIKFEGDSAGSQIRHTLRDSVLYTVTGNMQFDDQDSRWTGRVNGYRWARENGIIAKSNTSFHAAFTDDGYLTDNDENGHARKAGYQVMTRFITGDDIPEGFVFKGIEYIPAVSTKIPTNDMVGAIFYPVIMESNGGTRWTELSVGIDNMAFEVSATDVANLPNRYALPQGEANYSAVNVKFLDEPVLKKNTAYYFGYMLADNGSFELAKQTNYFIDGDTARYFSGVAETRPYYRQNYPIMPLDVIVYDYEGYTDPQTQERSNWIMGWSCDAFPMIRPIIGAPEQREPVFVAALCDQSVENGDSIGYVVQHNGNVICNSRENCAAGSRQVFDIVPAGKLSHSVVDAVYLNGVELEVHENDYEPTETDTAVLYRGSYNVIDTFDAAGENVLLYRDFYRLVFYGITPRNNGEGYEISADFSWAEWDVTGIDPVSPDVRFSVSPNPATSVVKLNVAGVNGMVNCSILDMSGRVIYNREINAEVENTINVSNFPAGAYFVRITNNTFSKIEKLIVK